MSDDESFLGRWARRKRRAISDARGLPKPKSEAIGVASDASAIAAPPEEPQLPLDLSSLPSIESIGPGADVRAFLAPGVPADLARAALRRAWSTDPVIRDFVGLSENSWNLNAPVGIPGFGSVTAEDVRRLLSRMMNEPETGEIAPSRSEQRPDDQATAATACPEPTAGDAGRNRPAERESPAADCNHPSSVADAGAANDTAMQKQRGGRPGSFRAPRHRHGGALPE